MFGRAPVRHYTRLEGELLHKKKNLSVPPPRSHAADGVSVQEDESFAFTSNGDEGRGRGRTREG